MTTGDWLGLVCLAGLVGFVAGGFTVFQLFFRHRIETDDDPEGDADGEESDAGGEEPNENAPPDEDQAS
jgi:hypothetical protein